MKRDGTLVPLKNNVTGDCDYVPTFIPATSDRAAVTRSTTATAERRQKIMPETLFVFNLSNEIAIKYTIFAVADQGLKPAQRTSARLRTHSMYLESHK